MNNLKKTLILTILVASGMAQTAFGVNASEYFTRHTREFLGYLGHHNPASVPVNKIMANDPNYRGAAGYAGAFDININEDLLARLRVSDACKLFTCAHEAAHFALGHAYQVRRNVLEIEQEADVEAGRMLCQHGYRWVLQGEVDHLRNLVNAGRGNVTDGQHPTTQQRYTYLNNVLRANGGQAGNGAQAGNTARNQQPRVPARNGNQRAAARAQGRRNALLVEEKLAMVPLLLLHLIMHYLIKLISRTLFVSCQTFWNLMVQVLWLPHVAQPWR